MKNVITFIKKNRQEAIFLGLVLLIALVLRLYRIGDYMTFLGDEGRDVRIVRDLITKGNLVFIGPQTSVGNMYLGPLYYYMMAPALLLSGLNPVGPAIMIALLGVITVWFTWFVARHWFGQTAAFVSALLFALSPVAIIYSRSSWNPNPMPFFALLCVWGIYLVWHDKKMKWLPVVGVSFGAALQMHYLGLLLFPALFVFWLLTLLQLSKAKDNKTLSSFRNQTIIAILLFFVLMSPLLLFDIKHNWMNTNAFKAFFSDRQTTVNLNPARSDRFLPVVNLMSSDLLFSRDTSFQMWGSLGLVALSIWIYFISKNKAPLKIILVWLGFAILGLGVYKQHVYIHYLGFIYPAVYLLVGSIIGSLSKGRLHAKIVAGAILAIIIFLSIKNSPLLSLPNNQLSRTETAVDSILKEAGGESFNFGLIAKQNYDESYRYFFENKKASLYRGSEKITNQLFVICEDGDSCKPEGNPGYEIAIFGPSHIVKQWSLDHLKIYKLVHSK